MIKKLKGWWGRRKQRRKMRRRLKNPGILEFVDEGRLKPYNPSASGMDAIINAIETHWGGKCKEEEYTVKVLRNGKICEETRKRIVV